MVLHSMLGVAVLWIGAAEPIDRAHGAARSVPASAAPKPEEPGLLARLKSRLHPKRDDSKPAEPSTRGVLSSLRTRGSIATATHEEKDVSTPEPKPALRRVSDSPKGQRLLLDRIKAKLHQDRGDSSSAAKNEKPQAQAPLCLQRQSSVQPSKWPTVHPVSDSLPAVHPHSETVLHKNIQIPAPNETKTLGQGKGRDEEVDLGALSNTETEELASEPVFPDPNQPLASRPSLHLILVEEPKAEATVPLVAQIPTSNDPRLTSHATAQAHPTDLASVESNRELDNEVKNAGFVQVQFPSRISQARVAKSSQRPAVPGVDSPEPAKKPIGSLGQALLGWIGSLPVECYPMGVLFLISVLVLVFSRGQRTDPQDFLAGLNRILSGVANHGGWQATPAMTGPLATSQNHFEAHEGSRSFGAITTTIGLSIVAVGGTTAVRAQLAHDSVLLRHGIMIAAAGQFVLLLGIVAMAARRARTERVSKSGDLNSVHSELVQLRQAMAMGLPQAQFPAAYTWQASIPISVSKPNQSGQIAQLKTQLASLSQQLDQLVPGEHLRDGKVA